MAQDFYGQASIRAIGVEFGDAAPSPRHLEILSDLSAQLVDAEADVDVLSGLFERLSNELNIRAQFGFVARVADTTQISIATGELPQECLAPLEQMAKSRTGFYLREVQSNTDPTHAFIRSRGYRAFASEPIAADNELQGVLCFGTESQDDFDPEDLSFFRVVTRHIALAMDRASKRRVLEKNNRELQHRVNNMLSMVQAVAMLSRNGAHDLSAYQRNFDDRLLSLARIHNLLSNAEHQTGLRELFNSELGAFDIGDRLTMHGPTIVLPAMIATSVGLIIHELTANAIKFGALSAEKGMLSIIWSVHGELGKSRVLIHWMEQGGPAVDQPLRYGYGANLLDRSLSSDLNVHREFLNDGLRATIALTLN